MIFKINLFWFDWNQQTKFFVYFPQFYQDNQIIENSKSVSTFKFKYYSSRKEGSSILVWLKSIQHTTFFVYFLQFHQDNQMIQNNKNTAKTSSWNSKTVSTFNSNSNAIQATKKIFYFGLSEFNSANYIFVYFFHNNKKMIENIIN